MVARAAGARTPHVVVGVAGKLGGGSSDHLQHHCAPHARAFRRPPRLDLVRFEPEFMAAAGAALAAAHCRLHYVCPLRRCTGPQTRRAENWPTWMRSRRMEERS